MTQLDRYAAIDAYTLAELRCEYGSSDVKGRIRLLERLYSGYGPPYEIALKAIVDDDIVVRSWIARNGRALDYRDDLYTQGADPGPPERDLAGRLFNDKDPFVRASLLENSDAYVQHLLALSIAWPTLSHLERLAVMRNRSLKDTTAHVFLHQVFDPEDQKLGVSFEERTELAKAYLTLREAVAYSPREPYNDFERKKHLSTLWMLASKWPADSWIPRLLYQYLGIPDEALVNEIVDRADERTLWALTGNQSLSAPLLKRIRARLIGLGVDKEIAKTISLSHKDDDLARGAFGAAYRELNEVRSYMKFGAITLATVTIVSLVGSLVKISEPIRREDWFFLQGMLAVLAISWVVYRSAKAILTGLDVLAGRLPIRRK